MADHVGAAFEITTEESPLLARRTKEAIEQRKDEIVRSFLGAADWDRVNYLKGMHAGLEEASRLCDAIELHGAKGKMR